MILLYSYVLRDLHKKEATKKDTKEKKKGNVIYHVLSVYKPCARYVIYLNSSVLLKAL